MTAADRLNIFYEEPDDDRWLSYDRYPRRIIRRIVRGARSPGGHARVFLNLCAGLDRIGVRYRVNDYQFIRRYRAELACIIGKSFVLDKIPWENPILFGAAGYSHPCDDIDLMRRLPVRKVLVPSEWTKEMFKPSWGETVNSWPVGIDTELWCPSDAVRKTTDVLLYDKVRWKRDLFEASLIGPIRESLARRGMSVRELHYGTYREEQFRAALAQSRTMIFLCEHETQGIAYQQALSCGVPILAWDRGGFWQDPSYYPNRVSFQPVTSVPYWDERCGRRFSTAEEFEDAWVNFWSEYCDNRFSPRNYVLENLTLQACAHRYVEHARSVAS